jgi:hypothetical protein
VEVEEEFLTNTLQKKLEKVGVVVLCVSPGRHGPRVHAVRGGSC